MRGLASAVAEADGQPERICRLCVDMLGVTGAGISMLTTSGRREVVCVTDEVAARIEGLQQEHDEGPSVDAVRGGLPVLVADLLARDDLAIERWPEFTSGVRAAGVRAVFAFPLQLGGLSLGALDLYRDAPGSLLDDGLPNAIMASDAAALSVLNEGQGRRDQHADDDHVRPVWQMQVHQAAGMVKVQLGITIEEAMLALRARAFSTSRPLAEVATEVVERRLRFGTDD